MSVDYKDYYKILDVQRSASKEEINKAYKKLARKYHPDLNQGDKQAEERFKEINEAHEVLKDPEKRRMYDQLGPNWQAGQNFGNSGFGNAGFGGAGGQGFNASGFSDFFETIFGGFGGGTDFSSAGFGQNGFSGFSQQQRKGSDIEAVLALSLEEAFLGGKKTITIRGKSLEITIPAGVKQGAKIRLTGQGDQGTGGSGDLYLKVNILPHKHFTLESSDVIYDLNISPWEATLGTKVRIPTLSGEVEMTVKPGTSGGKKMRIRGKGLGSTSAKGDQIIRIQILVPEKLNIEEKALWEQLQEISQFSAR